jgi:hypothetical protein
MLLYFFIYLSIEIGRWLPPLEGFEIPPLHFHTSVSVDSDLYIFGGMYEDEG